jgi:hypothetical protein
MAVRPWCDQCNQSDDVDHYTDAGDHKIGRRYGPVGRWMAIEFELVEAGHEAALEIVNRTEDEW